jgi:glucose/arabinose dehydrogenase
MRLSRCVALSIRPRLASVRGFSQGGAISALVAVVLLLGCSQASAGAAGPDLTGFADTQLAAPSANPLSSPTAIVPLDGGRALILEKGGAVRVLQADGSMATDDALTLSVCTDSEEGLLGAAVDPGFAQNGFVYLYYTRNAGNCALSTGRFNRVSRFTMTGNTINLASELVLLDNLNIPAGNHNGGDLEIGHDGDLYVTVGDGGTNPRGSGPSAAQDLSLFNGKILRITTSGGVPADNPFVGASGAMSCATLGIGAPTMAKCTEIYDEGLRNPFRFAFDPNTSATRFFINDVGQSTWEEVDAGGKGLNYGWDSREGFCNNGSSTACPPTPAGDTDPLTVYNHSSGCLFITGGAFIPNGVWAPSYDGGYLFADGGCGKVFLLTSAGTVDYAHPFAQTTGVITDMAFLTQGGQTALYYVTNATSQLHRITLPTPPVMPPVTPPIVLPLPQISVANAVSPARVSAPGALVRHLVTVTDSGTSAVTLASLQDSIYGDLTKATASTCAIGGVIESGAAYSCSFTASVTGQPGAVTDVVTATASGGPTVSVSATGTATVQITPVRCTTAKVRGLLASSAATAVTARHCMVRRVVIAMHHGAPLIRKHALVRASSTSRPTASPGKHRTWTLRVERTSRAGSLETIYVGWEATPDTIARKRDARSL